MASSNYHTYAPAGYCIYCGTTEGKLSKKHIIPYALNGNWVLPRSSCATCAKFTQKIEEVCTQEKWGMFAPLRAKLRMQSRSKRTRSNQVSTEVIGPGGARSRESFAADSFPAVAYGMRLPVAGILLGRAPTNEVECEFVFRINEPGDRFEVLPGGQVRIGSFRYTAFFQLLAKIGLSFAIAEMGNIDRYPMLSDIILGKTDVAPHLIGGGGVVQADDHAEYEHRLEVYNTTIGHTIFTLVTIHLFGNIGLPRYHVAVRERSAD